MSTTKNESAIPKLLRQMIKKGNHPLAAIKKAREANNYAVFDTYLIDGKPTSVIHYLSGKLFSARTIVIQRRSIQEVTEILATFGNKEVASQLIFVAQCLQSYFDFFCSKDSFDDAEVKGYLKTLMQYLQSHATCITSAHKQAIVLDVLRRFPFASSYEPFNRLVSIGVFPSLDDIHNRIQDIANIIQPTYWTQDHKVYGAYDAVLSTKLSDPRILAFAPEKQAYFERLSGRKQSKKPPSIFEQLYNEAAWLERFSDKTEDTQKKIAALKHFWDDECITESVTIPNDLLIYLLHLYCHLNRVVQGVPPYHGRYSSLVLSEIQRLSILKIPLRKAIYESSPSTFTEAHVSLLRSFSATLSSEAHQQAFLDGTNNPTRQYGAVALLSSLVHFRDSDSDEDTATLLTTWSHDAVTLFVMSLRHLQPSVHGRALICLTLTHRTILTLRQQKMLDQTFCDRGDFNYYSRRSNELHWPLLKTWSTLPEGPVRDKLTRLLHDIIKKTDTKNSVQHLLIGCDNDGKQRHPTDTKATKERLIWQFLLDTNAKGYISNSWLFARIPDSTVPEAQKDAALTRLASGSFIPVEELVIYFLNAIDFNNAASIQYAIKMLDLKDIRFRIPDSFHLIPRNAKDIRFIIWLRKKLNTFEHYDDLLQIYHLCQAVASRMDGWFHKISVMIRISRHLQRKSPLLDRSDWQHLTPLKDSLLMRQAQPFFRQVIQDLDSFKTGDVVWTRNLVTVLSIRCYLRLKLDIPQPTAALVRALESFNFDDAFDVTGIQKTPQQLGIVITHLLKWMAALLNRFPMPVTRDTDPHAEAEQTRSPEAMTQQWSVVRDQRRTAMETMYTAFLTWLTPLLATLPLQTIVACATFLYQTLHQTEAAYELLAPLTDTDIQALENPNDCLIAAECTLEYYNDLRRQPSQTIDKQLIRNHIESFILRGISLANNITDPVKRKTLLDPLRTIQKNCLFVGRDDIRISAGKHQRLDECTRADLSMDIVDSMTQKELVHFVNRAYGAGTVFVQPPAITLTNAVPTTHTSSSLKRLTSDREAAEMAADAADYNTEGNTPNDSLNRPTKKQKTDAASPPAATSHTTAKTFTHLTGTLFNDGDGYPSTSQASSASTTRTNLNGPAAADIGTPDTLAPMAVETPTITHPDTPAL